MRKKVDVVRSEAESRTLSAGTEENHENELRIANIRTQYLTSAAYTNWFTRLTSAFLDVI
jgi:hypothetical protein